MEANIEAGDISVIDHWHGLMAGTKDLATGEDHIFKYLRKEPPTFISVVFERGCSLQCEHCFYQRERSTATTDDKYRLGPILENLVAQIQAYGVGKILHVGRMVRPWHIDILRKIQKEQSSVRIGLIDSGSYVAHMGKMRDAGLLFDWLDISLDGTEEFHNRQRNHREAFRMTLDALTNSRRIVFEAGKVTSLFTLTTINVSCVSETADVALHYADELHICPISPRSDQQHLVVPQDQFEVAWRGIERATRTHGPEKVALRIYSAKEFHKLGCVVGKKLLWESFMNALALPDSVGLLLNVCGVRVFFFPSSLWPKEEIIVDADGAYRTGYSAQFTLKELASGRSDMLVDTRDYTIAKLGPESDFSEVYNRCVDQWWKLMGQKKFAEELHFVGEVRSG